MDEDLKVIPRTYTPRQIWVDGKLKLPPHIEAGDFNDKWRANAATGHAYVPLMMDFKKIGWIKTIAAADGKVDLCWSNNVGGYKNRQSITLNRFQTEGQDHVCLGCPGCGRPRKHLFLVAVRNKGGSGDVTKPFAFICKKCSGIDTALDRNSRRRNERLPGKQAHRNGQQ